jgi:CRISPR/Cas system CSM-associated protein Csm3 (group 7 of RAMP superfamily)
VKVNTFCVNHAGKAFIPGSTIKGVLFAWLQANGLSNAQSKVVFGEVDANQQPVSGGKAEFRDAVLTHLSSPQPNTDQNPDGQRRNWNARRGTCVEPRVAIDPRTKTADHQKLFQTEYVPDGSVFQVIVELPMASDQELLLLLRVFEAFNEAVNPLRIGSDQANNWGSVRWGLTGLEKIDAAAVSQWITQPTIGQLPFQPHATRVDTLRQQARAAFPGTNANTRLRINVTLQFSGPFLVNDPSQARSADNDEVSIGQSSLLRQDGSRFYLPSSSLRGAFRGQAARIWRTIAQQPLNVGAENERKSEAKTRDDLKSLQGFYRLFGAPGWRTPVEITDFEITNGTRHDQDFVAIDRFTGGGAYKKKFNARALYRPTAIGTISVDLARLRNVCTDNWHWAVMLMLFALRDLREGDITFGFGAGKGYGHCSAAFDTQPCGDLEVDAILQAFAAGQPLSQHAPVLDAWYAHLLGYISQAALTDHIPAQQRGT